MENAAGIEGAAVISVGVLEKLSNVSFSENTYYCRAGEYGYTVKSEARSTRKARTFAFGRDSDLWRGVPA